LECDCSVIIVTYNSGRYLDACLTSVQNEVQSRGEIIVVDNASADDTADRVRQSWPRVTLICNAANAGFAAACNQGAAAARGRYLVFLNQDTEVLGGWLAGLLAPLAGTSGIGLTTSKLLLMAQPGQINMCGLDVHYSGLTFGRGVLEPADRYNAPQVVTAVSGASFAISRALWQQLGGMDGNLFMYYEETDLSWRAQLAGYASLYTPTSVACHDGSLYPTPGALTYSARNRLVLILKFWKWPLFLCLLPGLLLAELIDWGLMCQLGPRALAAKMRGYLWLLAHLAAVRSARQRAASTARLPDWRLLERCAAQLSPRIIGGSPVGRFLVACCNVFLGANYRLALGFGKRFGL
jgi:GT2 family glycosyltransferase